MVILQVRLHDLITWFGKRRIKERDKLVYLVDEIRVIFCTLYTADRTSITTTSSYKLSVLTPLDLPHFLPPQHSQHTGHIPEVTSDFPDLGLRQNQIYTLGELSLSKNQKLLLLSYSLATD